MRVPISVAVVGPEGASPASGGAAPVFECDEMVGAYGISGGTSQQDEEMALYARAKVGWCPVPAHDTTDPSVKEHAKAGLGERKL